MKRLKHGLFIRENPLNKCYVTGYGSNSVRFPHHRPSHADSVEKPIPGLLAGGPNAGKEDPLVYNYTIPEMCYLDTVASYATNEVAINWNAPFVFLLEFSRKNGPLNLKNVYPERYQTKYGYWRPVIHSSIDKFCKCGDLKQGL